MKTLIFSDTHLGHDFEEKKFNILANLIKEADKVIINGDFWDTYLTTWDQFLNSEWSQLFPLLKERETIYIFGNHDKPEWMDHRMELFSCEQTFSTTIETESHKFIVEHGHRIVPSVEEKHPIVLKNKRLVDLSYRIYDFCAMNINGWFSLGYFENKKIIKWVQKNLKEKEILLCGHTHFFENQPKKRFINTGLIRFGYLQYAILDKSGIQLFDRRY